jgi:small-conductance mechanosensitive channel
MKLTDEQAIEYMYRNGHFSLPVADYITKRLKENEQLQAQAAQIREALKQVQHDIDGAECRDDLDGIKGYIDEALAAIDKIGGREDV